MGHQAAERCASHGCGGALCERAANGAARQRRRVYRRDGLEQLCHQQYALHDGEYVDPRVAAHSPLSESCGVTFADELFLEFAQQYRKLMLRLLLCADPTRSFGISFGLCVELMVSLRHFERSHSFLTTTKPTKTAPDSEVSSQSSEHQQQSANDEDPNLAGSLRYPQRLRH